MHDTHRGTARPVDYWRVLSRIQSSGIRFLEHVYACALERELIKRGHNVGREVPVIVYYEGEEIAHQRIDILVDGKVVVEIKSAYELHKAAPRQVFSYLQLSSK